MEKTKEKKHACEMKASICPITSSTTSPTDKAISRISSPTKSSQSTASTSSVNPPTPKLAMNGAHRRSKTSSTKRSPRALRFNKTSKPLSPIPKPQRHLNDDSCGNLLNRCRKPNPDDNFREFLKQLTKTKSRRQFRRLSKIVVENQISATISQTF